jgi:predicted Zn-dependent protease with MMP-like domain
MPWTPPSTRRILLTALAALTIGLGVVSLIAGFSDSFAIRLLQGIAVFGLGAAVVGGAVVLALVRLGNWRDPESEEDFEALVRRSERLAAEDSWGDVEDYEPDLGDDDEGLDVGDDDGLDLEDEEDFKALVRSALDDLPLEFHRALEHVAVVVADGGRRQRAYGLYQGDTVARDYFHDRIVIFRDTLLRDFGHDADVLRAQIVRTVRHELAHHLGWDEKGVRGLGL